MKRRIPPLNALKAFEVSARHLSFTNAATELNVTQSAISRQVKKLEEFLEIQLFERHNRALILTDLGRAYLPGLQHGFDMMDQATRRIVAIDSAPRLNIRTSLSSITLRWLMPRLLAFQKNRPNLEVQIVTALDIEPIDFAGDEIDVAFTRQKFTHDDLVSEEIIDEEMVVICSPEVQASTPLREKSDVANHRRIHSTQRLDLWNDWLIQHGVHSVDPGGDWRLGHFSLVIEAAMAGIGIALVPLISVIDALRAGHLIAPFEDTFNTGEIYRIVRRRADSETLHIQKFIELLRKEARDSKF